MEEGDLILHRITIYTDGACIGNPGPGGYGAVLIHPMKRLELSGGYCFTTNNRMELMAVIVALSALKTACLVDLYSDSQYVISGIEQGSAAKWRAKGWMRTSKQHAVNPDLWEQLIQLCSRHQVNFTWVRGHSGVLENEICDQLATQAAGQPDLPNDEGYRLTDSLELFQIQKNRALTFRTGDPSSLNLRLEN